MSYTIMKDIGVCVAGYTTSDDFPTTDKAISDKFGGYYDATFYVVDDDGSDLLYSTYILLSALSEMLKTEFPGPPSYTTLV